jgi:hypothetical protein
MKIEERISGFESLGKYLKEYVSLHTGNYITHSTVGSIFPDLENAVNQAEVENPWFTRENILIALKNISISLEKPKIEHFTQRYAERLFNLKASRTIGVVMAGNIPLVGFHDFLCILMAGQRFLGKLSTEDLHLLPSIADMLIRINPEFNDLISFTDERLSGFDSIIATGSNNTYRYFEYYFGKHPHILQMIFSCSLEKDAGIFQRYTFLKDTIFNYSRNPLQGIVIFTTIINTETIMIITRLYTLLIKSHLPTQAIYF